MSTEFQAIFEKSFDLIKRFKVSFIPVSVKLVNSVRLSRTLIIVHWEQVRFVLLILLLLKSQTDMVPVQFSIIMKITCYGRSLIPDCFLPKKAAVVKHRLADTKNDLS